MNRTEVIKILDKLAKEFCEDEKALEAISVLKTSASVLSDKKTKTKDLDESNLELPVEFKNLSEGYALFADGACRGNPGPGAYALILQNSKGEVILKSSGVEMPTTNNKMELQGVIRGLHGLIEKFIEDGFSQSNVPVFVYSDSKYVIDGISNWVPGWKARGWKKADNKAPENLDLWQELDKLKSNFDEIKFIWVKGHAGHPQNELCDKMANLALDEAGL